MQTKNQNLNLSQLLDVFAQYLEQDDLNCLSLPPSAYLSEELHALELAEIFKHEWLCVGRQEYIPEPGDYYSFDLLGDSLLIIRGDDGEVRALSNICRHRYMPLTDGKGNTRRIVCPYHAWTYSTEGQLVGAPYMSGSKRFDMASCKLPAYRLETWAGFMFVNFDDEAPSLASRMQTLDTHIANYRVPGQLEIMHYEAQWAGNWKLSAENSMEYYHHVGLHKDTVQIQMPAKNAYVPPPPDDLSFTHMRCGMGEEFKTSDHPMNPKGNIDLFTDEELTTGYMVYIFPAFTMAMRPNGNNWLSFLPKGTENTSILGGYLVSPDLLEESPDIGVQRRELILKVNAEDALATTELAKAMHSTQAERGPLGPFEGTVAQFYRYLARTLNRERTQQPKLRSV